MFYIDGSPILAEDLSVLMELKSQLALNGIIRFNEFKVGEKNIQFNCPIHSNGQERKPSCGISTVNQLNAPAGTVHCFTCGYIASLSQMISDCFGVIDDGYFGKNWLIKNFLTIKIEERKAIKLDFERNPIKSFPSNIHNTELNKYRYYHPYMFKRGLTNTIIEKYDVGYDKAFKLKNQTIPCITFPVRDGAGKVLFIARRAINQKLFHYPEGIEKPLYGIYELDNSKDTVYICESILDALIAVKYGENAIALLGLGTNFQIQQLKKLRQRNLILALDGDQAGQKASQKIKKNLKNFKIIHLTEMPLNKDLNDLSRDEFLSLKKYF